MNALQEHAEPEAGQVYQGSRHGEIYQILYVDEQIVLLRSDDSGRNGENAHRIERRVHFNDQIENGWFEYQPDSNLDMLSFSEKDWAEVAYVGEKTAQNLHDAGYSTNLDIQQATDDELLDVSGVGQKGATNLKEFSR
jgi:ERCC4-type nuclease